MFADKKVGTFPVILFLLPFLVLSFGPLNVQAQQVIVCKSQQDGIPRGGAIEWQVDSFPVQLTLFYHHGKTTISERNLNFIIEPEPRLQMGPFEANVVVSQGRNWASTTFMFTRAGKFAVTAYRSDRTAMATTLISIDGPEKEELQIPGATAETPEPRAPGVQPATATVVTRDGDRYTGVQTPPSAPASIQRPLTEEDRQTLRFAEVNIAFGTGLSGRRLDGVSDTFSDAQTRKGIVVQLSNPKPFASDKIVMDIWRKSSVNATDHDELVLNADVAVNPKAYTVDAPITLFKKGEYKVSFFTSEMVWIGSAYLTVK